MNLIKNRAPITDDAIRTQQKNVDSSSNLDTFYNKCQDIQTMAARLIIETLNDHKLEKEQSRNSSVMNLEILKR